MQVGDKVYFKGEKQGYTVQAMSKRFVICTKPFNAKKTVLYTIMDFVRDVRGPDNMIFGLGYETKKDCEERLRDLETGEMEVSFRRHCPIEIIKIVHKDQG